MTATQLVDDLTEMICTMSNLIREMQHTLSMLDVHDYDGEIELLNNWSYGR